MDSEGRSVQSAFTDAESKRAQLDHYSSSSSPDYQATLTSAIAAFKESAETIDRVSLFSPNESLEDIASNELQYLVVYYYLADLTLRRTAELSARKDILIQGRAYYDRFLKLLDSYDILSKSEVALYERYTESRDDFSVVATSDMVARRAEKIAKLKEEKELKRKLELLRQQPTILQQDDSALRNLRLTHISLCVHEAFQSLESLGMEFRILASMPTQVPNQNIQDDPRMNDRERNEYSERLDSRVSLTSKTGPILDSRGRPMRPFTLLDKRTQLQQGVFRPDYSLPTMSIDEYLEEEKRRGGIIEGGGEQSGIRPEPDEDNFEKADAETMKAREWDEFTEANPRGAGNTTNRG